MQTWCRPHRLDGSDVPRGGARLEQRRRLERNDSRWLWRKLALQGWREIHDASQYPETAPSPGQRRVQHQPVRLLRGQELVEPQGLRVIGLG
ncbi:DUF1651 domain-containing protein [Pseudomonas helleri]|uniref:DUF1651 domain-containing protein n=1 Tax=Pseudomonas helleri TaxID=1608996 RepID=UPI0039C8544C